MQKLWMRPGLYTQKVWGYAIATLIIGLVIGAAVGYVMKPVPPPEPPVGIVPKKDYDAAVDALNAAIAERDKAISERDAAISERDELRVTLDMIKGDLESYLRFQISNFINESKLPLVEEVKVEIGKPISPKDVPWVKMDFAQRVLFYIPRPEVPFEVYDPDEVRELLEAPPETLIEFNSTFDEFLDRIVIPGDILASVTWFPRDSSPFMSFSLIDRVTWSLKHDTFIEFIPIRIGRVSDPALEENHEVQQVSLGAPVRNYFLRSWIDVKSLITTELKVLPEKQSAPGKYDFELYMDFRSWFEGPTLLELLYSFYRLPTVALGSPLGGIKVEENILRKGYLISSLWLEGDANFFDREFDIAIDDRLEPGVRSYRISFSPSYGDFQVSEVEVDYYPPDEHEKSPFDASISSSKRVELRNSITEVKGHFAKIGSTFGFKGSILAEKAAKGIIRFKTHVSLTVVNILSLPEGGFIIQPGGFVVHDIGAIYVWDDFETLG